MQVTLSGPKLIMRLQRMIMNPHLRLCGLVGHANTLFPSEAAYLNGDLPLMSIA